MKITWTSEYVYQGHHPLRNKAGEALGCLSLSPHRNGVATGTRGERLELSTQVTALHIKSEDHSARKQNTKYFLSRGNLGGRGSILAVLKGYS